MSHGKALHEITPAGLDALTKQITAHRLYGLLDDPAAVAIFMRAHAFCVWDFQSLLKSLQRALTCMDVPWLPTADPEARRLINEIVLEEESDALPEGGHASHFELYLGAMAACGADKRPIEGLCARLRDGIPWRVALAGDLPNGVQQFVSRTLTLAESGSVPEVIGAFTYGREDLIPEIFPMIIAELTKKDPAAWGPFRYYLDRHVESDGERHGPISRALLSRLCGTNQALWAQAWRAAHGALVARIELWNAIAFDVEALNR